MTDPAVAAAAAGALGVVVGSLVSSVGVVLRERLVSRRERVAQQAIRLQQLLISGAGLPCRWRLLRVLAISPCRTWAR